MLRTKATDRQSLLAAALEGLELQKQRIDEQIREVRSMLGKPGAKQARAAAADSGPARTRRTLSPLARKRIAAAQKKRWAEYRKQRGDKKPE
ncbi:MAG: hypothetical protein ACRD4P_01470 [Bryobacteraceae bacterium]